VKASLRLRPVGLRRARGWFPAVIDVAIGIFIGLRGYSENEAFDEIVGAVRKTGVGPGSIATALLTACDHEAPKPRSTDGPW
jgi:hypothetical protein